MKRILIILFLTLFLSGCSQFAMSGGSTTILNNSINYVTQNITNNVTQNVTFNLTNNTIPIGDGLGDLKDSTIIDNSSGTFLTQNLKSSNAGYFTRNTNAFGTSNIFTTLVLDGDNTGSLYAIGRAVSTNEPFVALSGYDSGAGRFLYYGGGGWSAPDVHEQYFYTSSLPYTETNNGGILTLTLTSNQKTLMGYGSNAISSPTSTLNLGSRNPTDEDPTISFYEGNNARFTLGYDDANNEFKISAGSSLDTTDRIIIDSVGNLTIPILTGTGDAMLCVDSTGKLYRGNLTSC